MRIHLRAVLYTIYYTFAVTAFFLGWVAVGAVAEQLGFPVIWVAVTAAMIAPIAVTYAYPQAAREEARKARKRSG